MLAVMLATWSIANSLSPSVPSQPKLWNGPEILQVLLGDPGIIQWVLGGSPTPSVSWEHNERKLLPSERVSLQTEGGVTSLSITEVARSDEGTYACCALNSFGTDAKETKLLVMGKMICHTYEMYCIRGNDTVSMVTILYSW